MSSGRMNPLDTIVGVQRISRSLSRMVMLPSFAAAKPRWYTRRPISQICSFSLYSFCIWLPLRDRSVSPTESHARQECLAHWFCSRRETGVSRLLVLVGETLLSRPTNHADYHIRKNCT